MTSYVDEQMRKQYNQEHQNDHYFKKAIRCKNCKEVLISGKSYCANCGVPTNYKRR